MTRLRVFAGVGLAAGLSVQLGAAVASERSLDGNWLSDRCGSLVEAAGAGHSVSQFPDTPAGRAAAAYVGAFNVLRLQVEDTPPHLIALLTTSNVSSTELTAHEVLRRATDYEAGSA